MYVISVTKIDADVADAVWIIVVPVEHQVSGLELIFVHMGPRKTISSAIRIGSGAPNLVAHLIEAVVHIT